MFLIATRRRPAAPGTGPPGRARTAATAPSWPPRWWSPGASLWGWRRGESWVWWSLALAAAAGFLPAVIVHLIIGYMSFVHLAPVYLGIGLTTPALALARLCLCAREQETAGSPISRDRVSPSPHRPAR
ncbi:hypothetical protein ACFFMN_18445 [Planobispora siamensis]|nr:hypothetical protein [Planobispora siamensis]